MTDPGGAPRGSEPDEAPAGFAVLAALGIAALLVVAAGVVGVTMSMSGGSHTVMWGGPDREEVGVELAAAGFQLDGMSAEMVAHYEHARANAEVYAQIPCFCGCQEMLGHRNLEDCFVTPDGAWESHASGCQVCIDESQMVMRMMGRGVGPGMMRDRIVAAYTGPMAGVGS